MEKAWGTCLKSKWRVVEGGCQHVPTSSCRQQLTSGLPRSKLWNICQIFCARKQARPMRFLDLWSFLYEIFVPSGPYTTKLGTYYWEEPFFLPSSFCSQTQVSWAAARLCAVPDGQAAATAHVAAAWLPRCAANLDTLCLRKKLEDATKEHHSRTQIWGSNLSDKGVCLILRVSTKLVQTEAHE